MFVELPCEMQEDGAKQCGKLQRAMYGTRDAASAWQDEYEAALAEAGFVQGLASPCHFWQDSGANLVVRGDDFVVIGRRIFIDELVKTMGARYAIEVQRMGPRRSDEKSIRVLNRTIGWKPHGITMEADTKHADLLVRAHASPGERGVTTPCTREAGQDMESDV